MKNSHEFRVILTPFCNYRCFFCHKEGLSQNSVNLLLHPEDYFFVAQVARDFWHWQTMTLTGGEPLISPIFQKTSRLLAEAGIRLTVVTNASLLSSPRRQLKYISQINVSLHTLDNQCYRRITDVDYSPTAVMDTIYKIRQQLPNIEIHLNSTIMRGYNDDMETISRLLAFAREVGGKVKFIDLASDDIGLVVSVAEIKQKLMCLGFTEADSNLWQVVMARDDEQALITRCGFADEHRDLELRNLLLHPDGVISLGDDADKSIDVLQEIQSRDSDGFRQKVETIFPLLHTAVASN